MCRFVVAVAKGVLQNYFMCSASWVGAFSPSPTLSPLTNCINARSYICFVLYDDVLFCL